MIVKIKDIAGPNLISRTEGRKVYDHILDIWDEDDTITVSFDGVEVASLSFFNAAFSPFFFDHSLDEVKSKLQFIDISSNDKYLLNRSVKSALEQSSKNIQ